MAHHFDFTDQVFLEKFQSCTLDPAIFTHEAHLRLAWLLITELGVEKAIEQLCFQLQNYVESIGATDKFNLTLTIAAGKAVHHFMLKSTTQTFQEFIME